MKKSLLILSCALLVAFAVTSCNRSPADSEDSVSYVEKFDGRDYFPDKVGSQWTYQTWTCVTQEIDTVVVTVIGTHTLVLPSATLETTVWEHVWEDKVDTQLVAKTDDSVLVYRPGLPRPIAKYMLPLEDGASWTYEHAYGIATTKIWAYDTCSSCGVETFENCFQYYTHVEGAAFEDESKYWGWLVARVGTVWCHRAEEFNYSIISCDNWTLLEYNRATGQN